MADSMATRPTSIRSHHFVGITLLSFATLLLELSLTRVLSVASWYHFGFLVISTALLGFGVSGVVLSLWKNLRDSMPLDPALSVISLVFGFVTLISFSLMQRIPFQPFELLNDHKQVIYMLLYYLMLAAPFFCSGLAISLLLTRGGRSVNGLYAADMIGGGIACVAVCLTMPAFGGSGSIVVAALFGTLAALAFNFFRLLNLTLIGSFAAVGMCVLAFFAEHALPITVNPGKRLHPLFPQQSSPIYTKWNSFSKIDVYPAPALDPSRPDPGFYSIIIDGGTAGTGMDDLSMGVHTYLKNPNYHPAGVAYVGKTRPKVLVIGSGAGREVLEALYYGASSITAVEVNPITNDIVTRRFRDHWGGLFEQPEVHLITDEGRSFVRRSNEQYDVIVSVDTYSGTAVASGALTLAESYILTREAFEDYWNHLTPNGVLLVTGYDTTKLMSTARAMSDKLGVSDPGSHLFAYVGRGAAFGHFSLNSGFVLQKSPLSAGEVAEMARRAGIDGVNHPQEPRQPAILYSPFAEPHDVYQNLLADLAKSPDPEKVYAKFETYYPNPATDDKPFFHQTQRWGLHHLGFRSYFSSGFYTARNAQVTLVVLLIQSSLVAAVMILLPMVRFKRSALSARGCGTLLVYFASLGLGYVLIEIIFLQRFQLFLGPPIYTFSVVLAGLLTFTGLGSFAANGFPTSSLRLLSWLLLGVVAVITLELLVMPVVFNWALGFALAWRVTVSIALLAPVGLLLGMPFPIGLRLLGEEDSQLVPWAWAINAFFTVIGSVSAVILAMILGFTTVEMIAAACYGAALVAIAIRARLLATVAQPSLRQIAYSSPLSPGKEGFGIVNSSVSAPGGMSIVNRSISAKGGISSSLSSEEHERVISELKRIAHDLNLTEQQVATLQSTLGRAREGVTQYIKNHPNATKAEIIAKTKEHRVEIRQRVESFLSLEQLAKWDAEMTKTKEFLGQKLEV